MTQDLVSTAPAVYTALLGLVQTAAAAQNPAPAVFAFELGQYEPGSYVTVHAIENQRWDPETIGSFSQIEEYEVCGCATVFSGDSPATNPSVASTVLNATYSLFQSCVMTPAMSNRTMPILGGPPNVTRMLPAFTRYTGAPGNIGGAQGGWVGIVEWAFSFQAYVTPA